MANNNQNQGAGGIPFLFRIGFVVAVIYGAAWAADTYIQPGKRGASASSHAALREALIATDAKIWSTKK